MELQQVDLSSLSDGSVTLEPQTAAHAEALFAILSSQDVGQFLDQPPATSLPQFRDRLLRLEARISPDGDEAWLNWAVRDAQGHIAGYVQASVYTSGVANIAFVLGREFWGRGLAFAATTLMIEELRARFGVCELHATVDPRNERSIRLLSRLGLMPHTPDAPQADLEYRSQFPGTDTG